MNRFITFLIGVLFLSVSLFAQQKDTVEVKGMYSQPPGAEGELNTAIDAAIQGGTLSTTVFKLNPYDLYPVTGPIQVPAGLVLDLYAPPAGTTQESAPPQILWTASSSVTKDFLIQVYGDLIMKNIWVRYADVAGVQTGTPIVFEGDEAGLVVNHGTFENCLFEFMPCPAVTASGSICVRSKHFNGTFVNCFFRNCTDRHYMYYGRAVSFPFDVPGYHTDSVSFENCTFANMGYVYMQERTNYADNVHFNHCTFYNVVQFPLENGWWWRLNVNNCLFVNAWMMGYVPSQGASSATVTIAAVGDTANFAFEVPFTDQDRHVLFTNSAYYLDNWLVDWMRGGWEDNYAGTHWRPNPRITSVGNPYSDSLYRARDFTTIPYPRPMIDSTSYVYFDSTNTEVGKLYPYINRAELYDVAEIGEGANPRFVTPPLNMVPLKYFLWQKWDANKDSMWAYVPEAGKNQVWPLPENLAYANDTLKTAAMGGFPLGDLYHWWNPAVRTGATDYYSAWQAQADQERATITTWLETGSPTSVKRLPGSVIPADFTLSQNYPNPFNPTTQIMYSVPQKGQISLKVYNNLGQEVATLFNGVQHAGNYVATFNGTKLASGVYFYTLKSGNVTITKKLALIK
jgi:hypothetical protein